MRKVQFAVVQMTDRWCILLNGEQVGRFRSRADAVDCVMAIAGSTDVDGFEVEVLLQEVWGEILPVVIP